MEEKSYVDVAGEVTKIKNTFYEKWQEREGLPSVQGYFVEDVNALPLVPWRRKGGLGTFINLAGSEFVNDCYLCEIPPGGVLNPQRHLFEEWIYILKGVGSTSVWNEGGAKQSFEWQEGSFFSPPLNTWHQHFNGRGQEPAKYIAVTLAPTTLNMYRNVDFVFNNDFQFKERYDGQEGYFSSREKLTSERALEGNFVPDVRKTEVVEYKGQGDGFRIAVLPMSGNFVIAHTAEFAIGSYKRAHRHGPGAHILILSGKGYSLIWKEGQPRIKIPWKPGALFVPPEAWFHQHFNTGREPARYLAMRRGSENLMKDKYKSTLSISKGGDAIDYSEEDPEIREMFLAELAQEGVECTMPTVK